MAKRTSWADAKAQRPLSAKAQAAYEDETRISAFRTMAYRLRTDAGLTQEELAQRMGTTQSAIARMEGGGARPTLETLEKLVSLSAVNSSLGSVRTFQATAASPSSFATAMR